MPCRCGQHNHSLARARAVDQHLRRNRVVDSGEPIRIPTIVTICYQDQANARSETDIRVAMTRLNGYFNKTPEQWDSGQGVYSGDLLRTYQEHVSRAASAKLTFDLVHTRYQDLGPVTGTEPNTIDWAVKRRLPALHPHHALNIWVVDISGGLLGYAQFASEGDPDTDGVVVNRAAFGPEAEYPSFRLDATLAHEVGHWLELLHTFQDTFGYGDDIQGEGVQGQVGDKVADTPPQAEPTVGNVYQNPKAWHVTRPRGEPQAYPAMQNNVMNYTDDLCLFIITQGQVDRLRQALLVYRAEIVADPGWQYPQTTPAPTPTESGQLMYIPAFMVNWVLDLFNSLGLKAMKQANEDYLARKQ